MIINLITNPVDNKNTTTPFRCVPFPKTIARQHCRVLDATLCEVAEPGMHDTDKPLVPKEAERKPHILWDKID